MFGRDAFNLGRKCSKIVSNEIESEITRQNYQNEKYIRDNKPEAIRSTNRGKAIQPIHPAFSYLEKLEKAKAKDDEKIAKAKENLQQVLLNCSIATFKLILTDLVKLNNKNETEIELTEEDFVSNFKDFVKNLFASQNTTQTDLNSIINYYADVSFLRIKKVSASIDNNKIPNLLEKNVEILNSTIEIIPEVTL